MFEKILKLIKDFKGRAGRKEYLLFNGFILIILPLLILITGPEGVQDAVEFSQDATEDFIISNGWFINTLMFFCLLSLIPLISFTFSLMFFIRLGISMGIILNPNMPQILKIPSLLFFTALWLICLAVYIIITMKRLRDIKWSIWCFLVTFIPIINLPVFYHLCIKKKQPRYSSKKSAVIETLKKSKPAT